MKILTIYNGDYGLRHLENLKRHAPNHWEVSGWRAPLVLPQVIDYPEDYLPGVLPPAALILSFAEHKGVAELIPDIARMCGAKAVIAPVDNEACLPRGLARQLKGWLDAMGVACVTPKPLCSLSETEYWVSRRQRVQYSNELISEFAHYFGRPGFSITVDPDLRIITEASTNRDSVCGCARFVAEKLAGLSVDEAVEKAGLLHHHYPCLASMGIDSDFDDTLMHVSGNIFKDEISEGVKPYRRENYIVPGKRSEE